MVKPSKNPLNLSFSDDEQPDKQYVERLMSGFAELHQRGSTVRAKMDKYDALRAKMKKKTKNKELKKTREEAISRQSDVAVEAIRKTLEAVYKVRKIKDEERMKSKQLVRGALVTFLAEQARRLPLYVREIGEENLPPLAGACPMGPDTVIDAGEFVAAFSEEMDMWILAVIDSIQGSGPSLRYKCHDIEDESKSMTLTKRWVIPLPRYRVDPYLDEDSLYPENAVVMAMYPQTTCFYKAVVSSIPMTINDDYLIAFEDRTSLSGYADSLSVPQRYVIEYRDSPHKKKKDKRRTVVQEEDDD
ncbi:hypothetical protein L596_028129 [Steinernema carpocapsae]|uniref:SGF29 C-terminal domain-containing protein n=1 Tax=Steinernema carpocapsae TaxID=34508 RepID=A0A4U5LXI7_STECR|nr:hypothetical protein L596_028129 [Steinernema carpocapsae]